MSEPRVIKKYPNRRLYDTVESRYITLADVRRLVVERIDFVVVDKKNNADITRSILLQVIAEQEHLAEPILSQEFMVSVIRSYGTSLQGQVSPHLEQSLKQLMNQQPAAAASRSRKDCGRRRSAASASHVEFGTRRLAARPTRRRRGAVLHGAAARCQCLGRAVRLRCVDVAHG